MLGKWREGVKKYIGRVMRLGVLFGMISCTLSISYIPDPTSTAAGKAAKTKATPLPPSSSPSIMEVVPSPTSTGWDPAITPAVLDPAS